MPSAKQNKLISAIKNQDPREVKDAASVKGLDVNQFDAAGCTPLVTAINIGDSPEIVKHLLDAGAYASRVVGPDQTSPSIMAAIQNRPGIFKVLAEVLDPVLATNRKGWTCLNAAAHSGSVDIVKFILDNDPTKEYLDAKNVLGRTALHGAVIGQHKEVFELLLKKKKKPKIEVDEVDVNQATPLLLAAAYGNISMCKALISKGADMTITHKTGGNILHYVAATGHHEVLEYLLKQEDCPSIDAVSDQRATPLMMAVCHGYSDCVKVLLSHKAEPNIAMIEDGLSPLHVAARFHYEDIVRMLIHAGADPLAVDDRGQTPIDHAEKKLVIPPPPETEEKKDKENFSRVTVDNLEPDIISLTLAKPLGLSASPSKPGNLTPRSAGRNKAVTDLLEKEMTSRTNRYRGVVPKKSKPKKK